MEHECDKAIAGRQEAERRLQALWAVREAREVRRGATASPGSVDRSWCSSAIRDCPFPDAHQIDAMPYHRFKVGQTVVAPSGGPGAVIPRGPLVIVRLLPFAGGDPQYRVLSNVDGHERVVLERQIRLLEAESPAPQAPVLPHRRRPRR